METEGAVQEKSANTESSEGRSLAEPVNASGANGKNRIGIFEEKIRNHPILSVIILVGTVVIALGSFTDALTKIAGVFSLLANNYGVVLRVLDKNDNPIKNGSVTLEIEKSLYAQQITNNGEAIFNGLPFTCKGKLARVAVDIQGYKLSSPNQLQISSTALHIHVDKAAADLPAIPADHLRTLQIGILLSGDLAYTRKILHGLQTQLESMLAPAGYRPEIYSLAGPEEPLTKEGVPQAWDERINTILKRGGFNYLVGIGTQASKMLAEHLGNKLGETPYIFAGVTNPKRHNLVDSLKGRNEKRNIAGVAYLGEPEELAAKIHLLFPRRKLVFIYQRGTPQDEDMAYALKGTRLFNDRTLSIIRTENIPTVKDMPDPEAVYFSWYTVERMFEHSDGIDVLKNRLIIATTETNVKTDGLAAIGVSTDDYAIGSEAAKIIVNHALKGMNLGDMDVSVPELSYWINCKTASQRGIEFDPLILIRAKERFSCE